MGHSGMKSTKAPLEKRFHWLTLSDDIRLFVSTLIHCLSKTGGLQTDGGECVPRPFGAALHGAKKNALMQFD